LARVAGASCFLQAIQDIRVGGRLSNALFQFTLQDDDLRELNHWAPRMMARLQTLPGLVDMSTDQQNGGLQMSLAIDRDTAARLGVTTQAIDDALYDAFGQRQVSTMYTQLNQYHVVMEVAPRFWQSPETLQDIYVRAASGKQVPLSAFTHFAPTTTALAVNHQGQFPAVTLSFNLAPGVALNGVILLIGIVRKNAIMMIEFALEADRTEGKGPEEAIYEACLLRFRPIMMTTMAALLGALALARGTGAGAELRRPIGITIVGGLVVSQLLTLYTTPVVYLYLDRLRLWFARWRERGFRSTARRSLRVPS